MKKGIFTKIAIVLAIVFAASTAQAQFTLQVCHSSDLEGGVDAIPNAPNYAAIVDALEDEYANTVIISGGDNYIPGAFFGAAGNGALRPTFQSIYQDLFNNPGLTNIREGEGRADITIMNIIGFDCSAVGNHEFDAGPNTFEGLVESDIRGPQLGDIRWLGTQFPYLSANLDFSNDGDLAGPFTSDILPNTAFRSNPADLNANVAKKIAPATIIERSGEKIGVVGATTQLLESITSNGNVEVVGPNQDDMIALAGILQPVINDLINNHGINKVIVTTHLQQIANEKLLATLLSGVDIIIAGGSDVLQAQADDVLRAGDVAEEDYPFATTNADGEPCVVVGTDGEYTYVGRLIVDFDANGVLVDGSWNNAANGAYATIQSVVDNVWGGADAFAPKSKGELVKRLTDEVQNIVNAQDAVILGKTSVFLEGNREFVRTQETNLGNLTADANLVAARAFDPEVKVSLKNGGGIRSAIGGVVDLGNGVVEQTPPLANPVSGKQAGEISQLDVTNSLRFNNALSVLTLTYQQFLEVVEHSVAASTPDGNTPGQFPQIGGFRFEFMIDATPGNRVRTIQLINDKGFATETILEDGNFLVDPNGTIKIVTLNFLAGGGDSYPYPSFPNTNRVDLNDILTDPGAIDFAAPGTEQDALAEYLLANFSNTPYDQADTPEGADNRIRILRQAVPTMGEWALFLFGLTVLTLVVVTVYNKRRATA